MKSFIVLIFCCCFATFVEIDFIFSNFQMFYVKNDISNSNDALCFSILAHVESCIECY